MPDSLEANCPKVPFSGRQGSKPIEKRAIWKNFRIYDAITVHPRALETQRADIDRLAASPQ